MSRHAVIVAGGGVVGATAAALLQARARLPRGEVVLVERAYPETPRPGTPLDLRVSAISRAGRRVLEQAGAWAVLEGTRLAPYERLRVWTPGQEPRGAQALCFDAGEIAAADLGCIAENRALQAAAVQAAREVGVTLVTGTGERATLSPTGATLRLAGGELLEAELLVIADGADSPLRHGLGIEVEARSYGQRAVVARLQASRAHESTAWQCFLPGGPVALLPLPGNDVSLVWSAPEQRAAELLAMDEARFCAELESVMSPALGELRLASERAAFPLRRQTAARWAEPGCVLVGDAAHTLHPLAGQGLNQGLLDVAALVEEIAARPSRESPGALRALRRYERRRRTEYALVAGVVDGFDRAFTGGAIASLAGQAALSTAAHSRALRALFMREAGGAETPQTG